MLLSVVRFTASVYPFGMFKIFYGNCYKTKVYPCQSYIDLSSLIKQDFQLFEV